MFVIFATEHRKGQSSNSWHPSDSITFEPLGYTVSESDAQEVVNALEMKENSRKPDEERPGRDRGIEWIDFTYEPVSEMTLENI